MTEPEKLAILFAAGSGLRQGEQFNLELIDLHVGEDEKRPYVVVRFGSNGKPRKNDGPPLVVYIFGVALWAIRRWLEIRTQYLTHPHNGYVYKSKLVWPSPRGSRRRVGKPLGNGNFRPAPPGQGTHVIDPKHGARAYVQRVAMGKGTHIYLDRFEEVLAQCGITRNVRWHDMRHTCASALVSGMWGEAWTLQEVRDHLDHSSVTVTERYAHLAETAKKKAVDKVRDVGAPLVPKTSGGVMATGTIRNDFSEVGPPGLEPGTYGLKGQSVTELLRALAQEKGPGNQLVTNLATTLASLLEEQS